MPTDVVRRHVAVCAFPFGTHAGPLLLLTRTIAAAAPDVLFSFFNTEKSNTAIFNGRDHDHGENQNIRRYTVHDGVPGGHVFSDNPVEPVGLFLQDANHNIRRSMYEAEAEVGIKIGCIMTDAFLWFCSDIAQEKEASWIAVWTAGPNSLSAHVYTDLLRVHFGVEGIEGREEEKLDFIPGLSSARVSDLPGGIVSEDLQSPLNKTLYNMAVMLPKATAVVINSFEELAPDITYNLKTKFNKYLSVGPFSLTTSPTITCELNRTDTYDCMNWLDNQHPGSVAYICFGSFMTPPPHEVVALAEALEASEFPFLWSMKDNFKVHLPEGFIARTCENNGKGKIVPWAPQSQLLRHSSLGVFITHCGWNSILESMDAGVPMICRPFFADQKLNMRFVECVWRIGVGLEGGVITKGSMLNTLEKVLSDEEGKRMRKSVKLLQDAVHGVVEPDGSSYVNLKTLIGLVSIPELGTNDVGSS